MRRCVRTCGEGGVKSRGDGIIHDGCELSGQCGPRWDNALQTTVEFTGRTNAEASEEGEMDTSCTIRGESSL